MGRKQPFIIILLSLLWVLPKQGFSQKVAYTPIKTIKAKETQMLTDAFGNVYLINDYRLTMYNESGDKIAVYEDYKSGKISYVDVINPLKILVYYKEFMVAKVLDRKLSELASLSLNEIGFYSVDRIANANDGNFWLYDNSDFKLKKINTAGEILNESESFTVLLNEAFSPIQILDYGRHIYLNDPNVGVLMLDRYGSFKKNIPLKTEKNIQVIWGRILYFENNQLHSYNEKTFEVRSMALPEGISYEFAQLQKDRIYVQTDSKVMIYHYEDLD